MQGMWVRSLIKELRSHMPLGQKTEHKQQKQHCNKFNKYVKTVHIQKILKEQYALTEHVTLFIHFYKEWLNRVNQV